MKISMKKLFKKSPQKLEKWQDTTVKGSSDGIVIGKKLYKKPQDLKKPSIQIYDDISKAQIENGRNLFKIFEEKSSEIRKKLENKVNEELLKKYDENCNELTAEIHKELVRNKTTAWKALQSNLKDDWNKFDKRKEVDKDEYKAGEKGRSKSIKLFEEAKDVNSEIWKKIRSSKLNGKDFCAVTSALQALTLFPTQAEQVIEESQKILEKGIEKLEKLSQELLAESNIKEKFRNQISAEDLRGQKRKIDEKFSKKSSKIKEKNKSKAKEKMDNTFNEAVKNIIVNPFEELLKKAKNNLKKVEFPEKSEDKVDEIVQQFETLLKETKNNLKKNESKK